MSHACEKVLDQRCDAVTYKTMPDAAPMDTSLGLFLPDPAGRLGIFPAAKRCVDQSTKSWKVSDPAYSKTERMGNIK